MKLDNKRAPYAAGPLRQASRLCIRVTMVRCLADIPEPRYSRVTGDDGLELSFPEPSPVRIEALEHPKITAKGVNGRGKTLAVGGHAISAAR